MGLQIPYSTARPGDLCVIELTKNGPCRPAVVKRTGREEWVLEVATRAGRMLWKRGRPNTNFWGLWLAPVSIPQSEFLNLPDWQSRSDAAESLLPYKIKP